jgi:hypothetical protein
MNIFVLDDCPERAAQYQCDKHIPKMVTETFQMMGSALRRYGATDDQMPLTKAGTPLIGGYKHHPCTRWCGDTRDNFNWLGHHGLTLCNEYFIRYDKVHSCQLGIEMMVETDELIPSGQLTPYAQAMPDEYRQADAVAAYRAYYVGEKSYFARWERGRITPRWFRESAA